MPFPISITSQITLSNDRLPPSLVPTARLHDALRNETVDGLQQHDDRLTFEHRKGIHAGVARPGGQWWLFEAIDAGSFEIIQDSVSLTIHYVLIMRTLFLVVTGIALGVTALIYYSGGREWGFLFGCGIWLVMFASQYASKSIEIRRWLKKIMTSEILLPSAALRMDQPG